MRVGSIVETVGDFESLRQTWGLPYPKKGDVLIVSDITEHTNAEARANGIVLLHFEELPDLPGVCDKEIGGKPNFVELLLPEDIEELINAPIEVECTI